MPFNSESLAELSTRMVELATKNGFKLHEVNPGIITFMHEDAALNYKGTVTLMFDREADGALTIDAYSMSISSNPVLDPPTTHKQGITSYEDVEELMTDLLAVKARALTDTGTVWELMEPILSASPTRAEWITACLKSHPEGDDTENLRDGRLEEWLSERTDIELSRLDQIISDFPTMSQKEQRLISDILTPFVLPFEFDEEYNDNTIMSVLTIRDAFMYKERGQDSKFLREDMTRGLTERYESPDLSTDRLVTEAVAIARFAYELHDDLHPATEPDSYDPAWSAWRYRDQELLALLREHADRIDDLLVIAREHFTVKPEVLEPLIAEKAK